MRWAKELTGRTAISAVKLRRWSSQPERSFRHFSITGEPPHRAARAGAIAGAAMTKPVYRRVVAKISGEALMGSDGFGGNQTTLERIAVDLVAAHELGTSLGVVIGGGNSVRGVTVSGQRIRRVARAVLGLLGTVEDALAIV